jgi:hypothetical protein
MHLNIFLSNRTNFTVLDDKTFCKILGCLRKFIRIYYINNKYSKINSFLIMDQIIKKAVPISKIIYQRRGRIFIPLKTYYFNPIIRNSLAMKFIYKETSKIPIQKSIFFEQKLLILLLNILTIRKSSYIYQYDQGRAIRKKSWNRNYYLKVLEKILEKTFK